MSIALDTRPMDAEEARLCVDRIKHFVGEVRHEIQRLHDRRGWEALQYDSWEACIAVEFPELHRRTVFAHLQAANVERDLASSADVGTAAISKSNLVELATLPTPERAEVARSVDLATISTRKLREEIKERRTQRVRDARRVLLDQPPANTPFTPEQFALEVADCADLPEYRVGADLIVTSPPYGLAVDGSDASKDLDWDEYCLFAADWCSALYRSADPDHGRICVNVPLDRSKGSREPVYADWLYMLHEAGFNYESTIVWKEGNTSNHQARGSVGSPNAPHYVAPIEMILVMYRGEWNRGEPERPSDIREMDWIDWLSNTWTFAGEHRYRVGHGAPFPEELARRCILLFSFPGDLVADPFVGSGTTAVAALRHLRRFRGSDVDPECIELTRARVARELPT